MNARIVALLAIMTAFASLGNPVQAQSSEASSQNTEKYLITGDSLTGIDNRNAQQDFNSFFEQQNPAIVPNANKVNTNISKDLQLQESLSEPNSSVFFVPVQSFNGNDGTQVQFDLGNSK
ncbi:hypothetical protein BV372_07390 [Nostoc sp. T09]|uniref:hypothetical protein n=1 Tax=Nostoc sp. T09 TaxID=1932621 RepID=UPI000A390A98|nr:hypothetical protein [Nostoc sp. T09]OUL36485.1 hypothetical protein BV372_07390 [Nostoc sp. T09]